MTNFDAIKSLTIEQLADFLHNVQETTLNTGNLKDSEDWKIFLSKEISK